MSKKSKKSVKVAVVGGDGRMGLAILSLAEQAGFEAISVTETKKFPDPKAIDVVIEFSSPVGLALAIEWCVKHKKPLVSGTTGLSPKDQQAVSKAAKSIPILQAANMSLGIAVMNKMLERFSMLQDWDFHVDEVHHNQKKDKPSGTALLLDRKLSSTLNRKLPTPNSIRGGGVPGIHQVWAMGPEEVVVLQHTAFDRKVFARGALRAARWLFDKDQPGLYDISDLIS